MHGKAVTFLKLKVTSGYFEVSRWMLCIGPTCWGSLVKSLIGNVFVGLLFLIVDFKSKNAVE